MSKIGHRSWSLIWPRGEDTVQIDIGADGTVSGYSIPELRKLRLAGSFLANGDISKEQAVELAREAVAEKSDTAERSIKEMLAKALLAYVDLEQPQNGSTRLGERLWYVNFDDAWQMLVNQNSEIISCTRIK